MAVIQPNSGVHENIISIIDLSETHWSTLHASSETDMPQWRPTSPIADRNAPSETKMPHRRPKCPIGDRNDPSETEMPHRRQICPIRDRPAPSETDMPGETHQIPQWVVDQACQSLMWHVCFGWAFDEACRGLRWVSALIIIFSWTPNSDQCYRHMGVKISTAYKLLYAYKFSKKDILPETSFYMLQEN